MKLVRPRSPTRKGDDGPEVSQAPCGGRVWSQSSRPSDVFVEVERGQLTGMLDDHIDEVCFEVMMKDVVRDAMLLCEGRWRAGVSGPWSRRRSRCASGASPARARPRSSASGVPPRRRRGSRRGRVGVTQAVLRRCPCGGRVERACAPQAARVAWRELMGGMSCACCGRALEKVKRNIKVIEARHPQSFGSQAWLG